MMSLTYGQIGVMEGIAGFFAYFVVMAENGFWPSKLVGLRSQWESRNLKDLEDSYGQNWVPQRVYHEINLYFFKNI